MAFALLQHSTADGVGSDAVTSAVDTTGAKLIVVGCTWDPGAATPTLSDSQGNSWTGLTVKTEAGNAASARLFYKVNPSTSATHTFTLSGNANYQALRTGAYSGNADSSPFDVENGATSGSASSLATGSIMPTIDNELIVTCCRNNGAVPSSIDGSFTTTDLGAMGYAYLIQTTATAANPTWTYAGSGGVAEVIAAFKLQTTPPDTQIWTTFRV